MRIETSELSLSAASSSTRMSRSLEVRGQLSPSQLTGPAGLTDSFRISDAARELSASQSNQMTQSGPDDEESSLIEPKLLLAAQILARFFGREITVFVMQENSSEPAGLSDAESVGQADESMLRIQRTSVVAESESLRFQAEGSIQTSDGREIELAVDLALDRNWLEISHLDLTASEAQLKDPLVLNLSAGSARLGSDRFAFDISASGVEDTIPVLEAGSAFLALDRNGNGFIDDGSELFGARTGDGFAELQALDDDRNGWIDSGDFGFAELRLWLDAGTSSSRLEKLAEVGVGAISLDKVVTPFSLRDQANSTLGELRSTGIFVFENGQVGTAQQIDLAV